MHCMRMPLCCQGMRDMCRLKKRFLTLLYGIGSLALLLDWLRNMELIRHDTAFLTKCGTQGFLVTKYF